MALLLMDGFDCYDDITDVLTAGWGRDTTNQTFNPTGGRYGGGALANTINNTGFGISVPGGVAQGSEFIVGFAYYHNGAGGATDSWVTITNQNGNTIARMTHSSGGGITLFGNGATALGTASGSPLSASVWHWVELKVLHGTNATNGAITLQIDGATVATFSSIDTFQAAGDVISRVALFGSGGDCLYDDIVMMDDSGSAMNDFIGDSRIGTVNVSGAGGTNDWSANTGTTQDAVDDALGSSDGDTTYAFSKTAGQESRFALDSLSYTPATVLAASIRAKVKKDDAGPRTMRGVWNVNAGSSEQLSPTIGIPGSYAWLQVGARQLNLAGTDWTEANINDLEVGLEIVA